jgi:hypothetical protein
LRRVGKTSIPIWRRIHFELDSDVRGHVSANTREKIPNAKAPKSGNPRATYSRFPEFHIN